MTKTRMTRRISLPSSTGSANVSCGCTRTHGDERRWKPNGSTCKNYIATLDQVAVDSKFDAFQRRLAAVVAEGHRVIVFTQYLDTLDFIRNQLAARYGDQMACYSGRGGEIWDPDGERLACGGQGRD